MIGLVGLLVPVAAAIGFVVGFRAGTRVEKVMWLGFFKKHHLSEAVDAALNKEIAEHKQRQAAARQKG